MALCREMVQLVRRKAVDQIQNPLGGRQVPMMQEELHIGMVGILVDVVDPRGVEGARAPDDPMDFVPFGQ